MALFGKRPFDPMGGMPGIVGGYGGGTFNPDGSVATPTPSVNTPSGSDLGAMPQGLTLGAQPASKPGLFGGGKINWAGVIADTLAGAAGKEPIYAPAAMQQKLMQQRYQQTMAEKAADRQAQFQNEVALAQIKAANPGDDAFTRAMQAAGYVPGTPEYIALAKKRAEMLTNPVQLVSDGMGGQVAIRPYGGGASSPPTAPVGKITLLPGGGVGNGASGFRP